MDRLEGLHQADVVIVGSGLTALLLASALSDAGMRTAVIKLGLEAPSPPVQTASILQGTVYTRIKDVHGMDSAKQYAHDLHSQLHTLLSTPIPYVQEMPVYLYARRYTELPHLESLHALLTALGLPISIAPDAGGCPFPVERSLMAANQALVNVLQWRSALAAKARRQGVRFLSAQMFRSIENHRICTDQDCVEAQQIILASDAPLGVQNNRLFALLEKRRLMHCRLTAAYPLHSIQLPLQEGGLALLPTAGSVLAVQPGNQLGLPGEARSTQTFDHTLKHRLPDWTPDAPLYTHTTHALDGLPLIGVLPDHGLLCAAGCDHSPLASMHAAQTLTNRILGRMQPDDALYAPNRPLPRAFARRILRRISVIRASNALRPGAPECSLCRCRLRYSTAAQQWACPVCGSVFTMLGQIVSGPAIRPAQISIRQRPDV